MRALPLSLAPGVPGAGPLDAALLADDPRLGVVHFSLPPGGTIPAHSMPFEVVFLVLEGEGGLETEGTEHRAPEGTVLRCPPGLRRGFRNAGPGVLRVLVLKILQSHRIGESQMQIRRIAEQPREPNPHGVDVRRAYEGEHALASVITLAPGESLKRHATPVDVFFYVLSGEGTVEIGEESLTVGADTAIDSPREIPHRWINGSAAPLRVLVVKVPRPDRGTRLL